MFFFRPSWLQHGAEGSGSQPVFSVDIQAVGGRLASAGQDCKIRIWSCEDLVKAGSLKAASKSSESLPSRTQVLVTGAGEGNEKNGRKIPNGALLATLAYHAGAVNCVRFSPDGHFLASGGDDSVVLTYERLAGAGRAGAFGSQEEDVENWRCRKPLRAHLGDITDVAWSSDSDRFCSASVDNTVIVWSARTEKALVKLEGHNGLVKGVAWDPIGKFVASQSDDKSVIIWRTNDWNIEKRITAPFAEAILHDNNLAFFLRLNWSPCGSSLVATNAYAKKTATHLAPMFSRESGLTDHVDFIGHREPVVVGRFSPRLYSRKQFSGKEQKASKDNPAYTCVALGSKDRGASLWVAGSSKQFVNLEDMFGADVVDLAWGADGYTLVACSTDGGIMLIRFDPAELGYVVPEKVEQNIFKELWQSFGGKSSENGLPENRVQVAIELERKKPAKALETENDVHGDRGQPEVVVVAPKSMREAKQAQGKEENATPVKPVPVEIDNMPTPKTSPPTVTPIPPQQIRQREERVKGGRRRIIPQPLGTGGDAVNDPNSQSLGNIWEATNQSGAMGSSQLDDGTTNKRPRTMGPGDLVGMTTGGNPADDMKPWVSSLKGQSHLPSAGRRGGSRCRAMDSEPIPTMLEASSQGSSKPTVLTCSKGGQVLWRDYVGSQILALAGSTGKFAAVATADAFLHIYKASSGRRFSPPISLDTPPHLMDLFETNGKCLLLLVTRSAIVNLYALDTLELVCSVNAAPLLVRIADADDDEEHSQENKNEKLRRGISVGSVSDREEPILVLSDGHAFVYNQRLQSWLRVADDHSPNSEYYRLVPPAGDKSLLSKLQASTAI
uniref:Protein HIRA n=2 Tax=Rhodosorus marinus TaxID=101924 RepID=A0A7S2ZSX4_9RHOD|mmetsp:Transcript_30725/g.117554  ORF Transcript_30725/g.117554 Transcript_30725/m.117554 type:complete len:840 (+) Transcript_30725:589-3108(+)